MDAMDTRTAVLLAVATLTVGAIPIVAYELGHLGPTGEVEETVEGFFDDLAQRDVAGACDKLSAHGRTLLIKHGSRPMGATKATCIEAAALPNPPAGGEFAEVGGHKPEVSQVEITGNAARVVVSTGEFTNDVDGEQLDPPVKLFDDSVLHLRKGDEGWKIERFRFPEAL